MGEVPVQLLCLGRRVTSVHRDGYRQRGVPLLEMQRHSASRLKTAWAVAFELMCWPVREVQQMERAATGVLLMESLRQTQQKAHQHQEQMLIDRVLMWAVQ